MSQNQDTSATAQQNFTLPNSYLLVNAADSLAIARCSEVYLNALEHYITVTPELSKDQLLQFLRLYRVESAIALVCAANTLKGMLDNQSEGINNG